MLSFTPGNSSPVPQNGTAAGNSSKTFNLGNSLVEITALTTLIGSNTAEQLTLGNRGSPGLAWVGMSTFGSVSVLRACVAAATPGWLRGTLSVRNATRDAAIGLSLNLSSANMERGNVLRKNLGEAVGVICERRKTWRPRLFRFMFPNHTPDILTIQHDVYAFDQFTLGPLKSIVEFSPIPDNLPPVYIFPFDPLNKRSAFHEWIELLLTLSKLVEVFSLYKLNGGALSWVTALNWCYFFIAASLLQSMQVSRGYSKNLDNRTVFDIISGDLPTTRRQGGKCRILLDAPSNFQHHALWTLIWMLGALICAASLILCYILLTSRPSEVVYVWLGFQVFWLLCRSMFLHVTEGTDEISHPALVKRSWAELTDNMKMWVLELVIALCKYQVYAHHRLSQSYSEDVAEVDTVRSLLGRSTFMKEYPLDVHVHERQLDPVATSQGQKQVVLNIHGIIGDPLLSSAAWFHGSHLTPMDLYDCCVLFLELPANSSRAPNTTPTKLVAVPAARPLCAPHPGVVSDATNIGSSSDGLGFDPLEIHNHGSPKGSPRKGTVDGVEWFFWIPCSGGRWIQVSSLNRKVLGSTKTAEVLTSDQLTSFLRGGVLNISLDGADAVREVVELSRVTMEMVVEFFGFGTV